MTIDELDDVIMFETFHDCDFAFEVGEELGRQFRAHDRFDGNHGGFALGSAKERESGEYHVIAFGDDGKRAASDLLGDGVCSHSLV